MHLPSILSRVSGSNSYSWGMFFTPSSRACLYHSDSRRASNRPCSSTGSLMNMSPATVARLKGRVLSAASSSVLRQQPELTGSGKAQGLKGVVGLLEPAHELPVSGNVRDGRLVTEDEEPGHSVLARALLHEAAARIAPPAVKGLRETDPITVRFRQLERRREYQVRPHQHERLAVRQ